MNWMRPEGRTWGVSSRSDKGEEGGERERRRVKEERERRRECESLKDLSM